MRAPTILVVEDDTALCEFFEVALTGEGWTVVCATNGPDAIRLAADHPPVLVVLDFAFHPRRWRDGRQGAAQPARSGPADRADHSG